jgi:hypothetical protein
MVAEEGISAKWATTLGSFFENIDDKKADIVNQSDDTYKNSSNEHLEPTVDDTPSVSDESLDFVYEAKARVLNDAV